MNPLFLQRWAAKLLYVGLGLTILTLVIQGLGIITLLVIPCCFYLSWVAYVAAWPISSKTRWDWLRAALSALCAHLVLAWILHNGYLKSAMVCGSELLLALAWQWYRQGRGGSLRFFASLGLWVGVAWLGLISGSLSEAVQQNDLPWVRALAWSGANVNGIVKGPFGERTTVLYKAMSWQADAEVIGLLLSCGANPNALWLREDGTVVQPVAFALQSYHGGVLGHKVLRLLLDAHLNPCQPDQHGQHLRAELNFHHDFMQADSVVLAVAERRFGCQ